jgi:hypothetical protein
MCSKAEEEMESVDDDHLPDVRSNVMYVQIQWHDQHICDSNVADVEYAIIPTPYLGERCCADSGEKSNADDPEDHIHHLNALGEDIHLNKEVEVARSVQGEQQEYDAAKNLMGRLQLFVREAREEL